MIDVEFNFQNDLLTNKGLIMDFSKENLRSAASTGADQLSRANLHDTACRFAYYRVCQTNTALQAILILSQKPDRREQAPSFSPQLNQEKSVTTQEHSIRSLRLPGHDRVALHSKALKSVPIEILRLSTSPPAYCIWNAAKHLQLLETGNYLVLHE